MLTKLVPETVHNITFHIRIYLKSFVSIYYLYHLFGTIYKSIFYNSNIKLNDWFISKTINILGNFIWKCTLSPWYDYLYDFSSLVFYFSQ